MAQSILRHRLVDLTDHPYRRHQLSLLGHQDRCLLLRRIRNSLRHRRLALVSQSFGDMRSNRSSGARGAKSGLPLGAVAVGHPGSYGQAEDRLLRIRATQDDITFAVRWSMPSPLVPVTNLQRHTNLIHRCLLAGKGEPPEGRRIRPVDNIERSES